VLDSGQVDATNGTFVTTTNNEFTHVTASGSTVNHFTDCDFSGVYIHLTEWSSNALTRCFKSESSGDYSLDLDGDSTNTFEDCKISSAQYHTTSGNSDNTFTLCVIGGWLHFGSPSRSRLYDCTYDSGPRGLWYASTTFGLYDDTELTVTDLTPGLQASTVIQAGNNPFRVELHNTWVEAFHIRPYGISRLTVNGTDPSDLSKSRIWLIACSSRGEMTLINSEIENLGIDTSGNPYGPTSFLVDGFQDGVVQTTDPLNPDPTKRAWARERDEGPFRVVLDNTIVANSGWDAANSLGEPSDSLITYSHVGSARALQDSRMTVRDSVLGGTKVSCHIDHEATAELIVERCDVEGGIALEGFATTATFRDSELSGGIFFSNWWYGSWGEPQAPTLVLEGVSFDGLTDPRVWVDRGIIGARIEGDVTIDGAYQVSEWLPGSTIIRSFPVLVRDADGHAVEGARVKVTPPERCPGEDAPVWEGLTGADGYAYPEVTFDQCNYQRGARLQVSSTAGSDEGWLSFLTSTPVELTVQGGNTQASMNAISGSTAFPWAEFAAGPGEAATRLQLGNGVDGEQIAPLPHSPPYFAVSELSGQGITGLRTDLPYASAFPDDPSKYRVQCWTFINERTSGNSSAFFGYALTESYPSSASPWMDSLGLEVRSSTESSLRMGATSIDLSVGLSTGRWHLVDVEYDRVGGRLAARLNGIPVTDPEWVDVPLAVSGDGARFAVLGAAGHGTGASQYLCIDDPWLKLTSNAWPRELPRPWVLPILSATAAAHQPAVSEPQTARLYWGNGCPFYDGLFGTLPVATDVWLAIALPEGYEFVSASPGTARPVVDGQAIWHMVYPAPPPDWPRWPVTLTFNPPTTPQDALIYLWATADPAAETVDPPNPADWTAPYDPVWGWPQVVRHQRIVSADRLLPDIWVLKEGPEFASPGDPINYIITVGNCGLAPATEVEVRDLLPELLGGDDFLLQEIAQLDPGDTWRGLVTEELPWGVEHGTLLLNESYAPTAPNEVLTDNNVGLWETTVLAAHDPNCISVSPEGTVVLGAALTYTIECENTGAGTAYGVYATMDLDPSLDDYTLVLPRGIAYDPLSRTVVWDIGTLPSGAGASMSFTVEVAADAPAAEPIVGQAVIYFPSVPEVTPTNIVVNWLASLFSDVPPDHWAYDEIMACAATGIVAGYPDGSYQPGFDVTRAQMAVFIARAIATPAGEEGVQAWEAPETPTFPDVADYFWCYKHVEMLYDKGIVAGYPDGFYRPTTWVSRDQMAVYMARAVADPVGEEGLEGYTPPAKPSFLDADAEHWAYKHIEYCAENYIVAGYPDGFYRPSKLVTRDQMAVYVARAFGLM